MLGDWAIREPPTSHRRNRASDGSKTRARIVERFHWDGEREVGAVLNDLVSSGLVYCTGRGDTALYGLTSEADLHAVAADQDVRSIANVAWLEVFMGQASLASLCEALQRTGGNPCPVSRAALLAEVPEQCIGSGDSPGADPLLDRRCGLDEISGWYFDSASGALVGARISDTDGLLPCGSGLYFAGQWDQSCGAGISCSLCLGNPGECPADISAEIPTEPCGPWPPEPNPCMCPTAGIPTAGTLCDGCLQCGAGTCGADCVCMRDGNYRWDSWCTE